MTKQGTGTGDRGPENREQGTEELAAMLRRAMPPIGEGAEAERDLWPAMQARLRQPDAPSRFKSVPWFDWALAGGVAVLAVAFPSAVPVLLYYL